MPPSPVALARSSLDAALAASMRWAESLLADLSLVAPALFAGLVLAVAGTGLAWLCSPLTVRRSALPTRRSDSHTSPSAMTRSLLIVLAVLLAACDGAAPETPDLDLDPEPDPQPTTTIETIRSATNAYRDADRARADGYAEASPCVSSPAGGMGFHYMKNALLDGTVDPAAPEMLLFEPAAGGGLTLVGVEFMVPAADWSGSAAPRLDGVAFAAHLTPETQHGIPFPHYDLHVWAWRDNPDGMYAPFNPNVSCGSPE